MRKLVCFEYDAYQKANAELNRVHALFQMGEPGVDGMVLEDAVHDYLHALEAAMIQEQVKLIEPRDIDIDDGA